jgi:UDP-2,3-diacylglucosamine hydrolase
MDVDTTAVLAAFETTGTRELVHGHTHRPGEHDYTVGGETATRRVLDVWDERGGFLELSPAGWRRGTVSF